MPSYVKSMNIINQITVCIFFVLLCCCSSGGNNDSAKIDVPKQPVEMVEKVEENPFQLNGYQGKNLLVTFWATWCLPCVNEIPALIKMQQKYGGDGFSVVGISADLGGARIVGKFVKKKKINYPIYMNGITTDEIFGKIIGLPTIFLVDASGAIVDKHFGYLSEKELEAMVISLVGKNGSAGITN